MYLFLHTTKHLNCQAYLLIFILAFHSSKQSNHVCYYCTRVLLDFRGSLYFQLFDRSRLFWLWFWSVYRLHKYIDVSMSPLLALIHSLSFVGSCFRCTYLSNYQLFSLRIRMNRKMESTYIVCPVFTCVIIICDTLGWNLPIFEWFIRFIG